MAKTIRKNISPKKSIQKNKTPLLEHNKTPELFFGLIAPSGTDLTQPIASLKSELQKLRYKVKEVNLSGLITSFLTKNTSTQNEKDRLTNLMRYGTEIREKTSRGDAIALLGISEIQRLRNLESEDDIGVAYIIKSLKHSEEINTLRKVYGQGFYSVSVYSPRGSRINELASRIEKSKSSKHGSRSEAEALVERDESEKGHPLGQNVKDAFPLADFFLDVRIKKKINDEIKRFIELIFSHPYHTPTKDEYAMYHAKSAALRSADLGRQVGASITTKNCDLISIGCNDVPRSGGGLYWPDDEEDGRDFRKGNDPIHEQKEQILGELIERLRDNKWLSKPLKDQAPQNLLNESLVGKYKHVFKDTLVMNLLEFGRSVHAEMAALMDSARRGVSVKGATLYTTTFPCHLCAKHIIASGIDRVVYIEPYPKSRALNLFDDSISVDGAKDASNKISFEPFVGVAPRQYLNLFEAPIDRKDNRGKIIDWPANGFIPRVKRLTDTYIFLETRIIAEIIPKMKLVAKSIV